jgi:hypothetical protein
MKFGIRTPMFKKRLSARVSLKRYARHNLNLKMPKGTGFLTNSHKFAYNKVYNKTSVSVDKLTKTNTSTKKAFSIIFIIFLLILYWPIGIFLLIFFIIKQFK